MDTKSLLIRGLLTSLGYTKQKTLHPRKFRFTEDYKPMQASFIRYFNETILEPLERTNGFQNGRDTVVRYHENKITSLFNVVHFRQYTKNELTLAQKQALDNFSFVANPHTYLNWVLNKVFFANARGIESDVGFGYTGEHFKLDNATFNSISFKVEKWRDLIQPVKALMKHTTLSDQVISDVIEFAVKCSRGFGSSSQKGLYICHRVDRSGSIFKGTNDDNFNSDRYIQFDFYPGPDEDIINTDSVVYNSADIDGLNDDDFFVACGRHAYLCENDSPSIQNGELIELGFNHQQQSTYSSLNAGGCRNWAIGTDFDVADCFRNWDGLTCIWRGNTFAYYNDSNTNLEAIEFERAPLLANAYWRLLGDLFVAFGESKEDAERIIARNMQYFDNNDERAMVAWYHDQMYILRSSYVPGLVSYQSGTKVTSVFGQYKDPSIVTNAVIDSRISVAAAINPNKLRTYANSIICAYSGIDEYIGQFE